MGAEANLIVPPLPSRCLAMLNFLKSLFGCGPAARPDTDLAARLHDNLSREPSEELRAMLDPDAADRWSPEALDVARRLLDRRAKHLAPEPVYRTTPRPADVQTAWQRQPVAPMFDRRLLAFDVGCRVSRGRGRDGTIIRWDDETDEFFIRYDNGDGEWLNLNKLASG
jgi:hypothetical protein